MRNKLKYLIILSILIILFSILFTACDKNDENNLENFYGEYSIPLDKFFEVEFWRRTEDGYIRDQYRIVGVKQNSFVYAAGDPLGYEYKEMTFDENLLAEVDRLIELMGDHTEFDKNGIYFVDSRERLNISSDDFALLDGTNIWQSKSFNCYVHHDEENIYSVKYNRPIKVLFVELKSNDIEDTSGVEWEITISRRYKRY